MRGLTRQKKRTTSPSKADCISETTHSGDETSQASFAFAFQKAPPPASQGSGCSPTLCCVASLLEDGIWCHVPPNRQVVRPRNAAFRCRIAATYACLLLLGFVGLHAGPLCAAVETQQSGATWTSTRPGHFLGYGAPNLTYSLAICGSFEVFEPLISSGWDVRGRCFAAKERSGTVPICLG